MFKPLHVWSSKEATGNEKKNENEIIINFINLFGLEVKKN